MKIKIIKSCLVKGNHAEAGTVFADLEPAIAADLVGIGCAKVVIDPPAPAADEPEPVAKPGKLAKAKP